MRIGRYVVLVAVSVLLGLPQAAAQGKSLPDREAEPLNSPQPVYPTLAGAVGLSGYCDVRFDIDTQGRANNIRPLCSHMEFCASAAASMREARFMPARRGGRIVERRNVVYPLEYTIVGQQPVSPYLTPLLECVDPRIS